MSPVLLLLCTLGAPESERALQRALAAEHKALLAERTVLKKRAQALAAERARAQREGKAKIAKLAAELETLRVTAQRLTDEQRSFEKAGASGPKLSYGALFREAQELLEDEVPADPDSEGALQALFGAAAKSLEKAGELHADPETFYGPSGHPVKGKVLHAGALTAFGRAKLSDGKTIEGPLVRLDGHWTLLEHANVSTVFGDGPPGANVVPLALAEQAPDNKKTPTLAERINAGGPLAWPILSLGAVVLIVLIFRLWSLSRDSRGDLELEVQLVRALSAGRVDEVRAAIGDRDTGVARLARAILSHKRVDAIGRAELASSALIKEVARAERWLSLLKLIAAVAPLLGLLGTVMGMIETFDVISAYGSGDASRLSGGISKALITTELGLIVAVPTLFVHGALSSWVDRVIDRLERVARDLPALLSEAQDV